MKYKIFSKNKLSIQLWQQMSKTFFKKTINVLCTMLAVYDNYLNKRFRKLGQVVIYLVLYQFLLEINQSVFLKLIFRVRMIYNCISRCKIIWLGINQERHLQPILSFSAYIKKYLKNLRGFICMSLFVRTGAMSWPNLVFF